MVKFHPRWVCSPRCRRSRGEVVKYCGRRGDTGFWQGQQVLGVPPLSVHNHFAALPVDKLTEIDSIPMTTIDKMKAIPPTSPWCLQLPQRLKWEKQLPKQYIITVTLSWPGLLQCWTLWAGHVATRGGSHLYVQMQVRQTWLQLHGVGELHLPCCTVSVISETDNGAHLLWLDLGA